MQCVLQLVVVMDGEIGDKLNVKRNFVILQASKGIQLLLWLKIKESERMWIEGKDLSVAAQLSSQGMRTFTYISNTLSRISEVNGFF